VLSNGPGASSRVRVRVGDQRVVRVVSVRAMGVMRVVAVWLMPVRLWYMLVVVWLMPVVATSAA